MFAFRLYLRAVEQDSAGSRPDPADDGIAHGRLARAIGAYHHGHRPAFDGQRQIVYRLEPVEIDDDIFKLEHGNGHGAASPAMGCDARSEEHTSELQSLMRISYAVFCLKKKITTRTSI